LAPGLIVVECLARGRQNLLREALLVSRCRYLDLVMLHRGRHLQEFYSILASMDGPLTLGLVLLKGHIYSIEI
jgi:hypothetical protein